MTQGNFETNELSWHDNLIYGVHFQAADPERGKWRSNLTSHGPLLT